MTRLKILLYLRALLELYKPLSQKFGYFNEEYDERINMILNKIKICINNHNNCFEMRPTRYNKEFKKNKVDKFENQWNIVIKKFIANKIDVEIIQVPIIESIKYIVVDIKIFEEIDREGRAYKTRNITNEVAKFE